jgi:hypothetical protein
MLKKLLIGSVFGLLLSAGAAMCAEVIIKVAPPAPRTEVRVASPGAGYVWTPGYYNYVNGAHVWVGGTWVLPPHPGARWVAHRWVRRHGGWVLAEGHWR